MSSGFARGFISAFVMLGLVAGAVRAAEWIATHPTPEAVVAWVTRPRLSILGVVQIVLFVVIAYAVIWTIATGPRM